MPEVRNLCRISIICLISGGSKYCRIHPYTTGTRKAAKISNENSFLNWVDSLHMELMNASHSTNLFTNSCDHISTNGKAPLHSHINHNNPQFLYSLWRRANPPNVSLLNLANVAEIKWQVHTSQASQLRIAEK